MTPSASIVIQWSTYLGTFTNDTVVLQDPIADPDNPGYEVFNGTCVATTSSRGFALSFQVSMDTSLAAPGVPIYGDCILSNGVGDIVIVATYSYLEPPSTLFTVGGSTVYVASLEGQCLPSGNPMYGSNVYYTVQCTLNASNATSLVIGTSNRISISQN